MIMSDKVSSLIDPKKKAVILQRIKDGKEPFCAIKPEPEPAIVKPITSDKKSKASDKKPKIPKKWQREQDKLLVAAAGLGNLTLAMKLIKEGADVDARFNGNTALITAIKCGHPSIARLLIEKGADVNAKNRLGTALKCALKLKMYGTAQLLCDNGAI